MDASGWSSSAPAEKYSIDLLFRSRRRPDMLTTCVIPSCSSADGEFSGRFDPSHIRLVIRLALRAEEGSGSPGSINLSWLAKTRSGSSSYGSNRRQALTRRELGSSDAHTSRRSASEWSLDSLSRLATSPSRNKRDVVESKHEQLALRMATCDATSYYTLLNLQNGQRKAQAPRTWLLSRLENRSERRDSPIRTGLTRKCPARMKN